MSVTLREIESQPADVAPGRRPRCRGAAQAARARARASRSSAAGPRTTSPRRSPAAPRVAGHRRDRRVRGLGDAARPPLRPGGRDLALGHHDRGRARRSRRCPPATPSLAISAVPDTPVVQPPATRSSCRSPTRPRSCRPASPPRCSRCCARTSATTSAPAIADAEALLAQPLPVEPAEFEQFVFLGRGWTVGLAFEAALKFREAAGRVGRGLSGDGVPPRADQRRRPGHARVVPGRRRRRTWSRDDPRHRRHRSSRAELDPMAELVTLQRAAVALAQSRGLDPDQPQHLTRSVVSAMR